MSTNKSRRLGRYELLTRIASGGMAEIHLARQLGIEGFERLVVIKLIHPHLADEKRFVEMFLDEARIAARLNHPNVVQIYDFGKEDDEYFIAMEYLEGESLGIIVKAGLDSGKTLDQHLAAGIVTQLGDGLEYAHKFIDIDGQTLNIVHRDVSPQNIIALYSGMIKLVDFGIAKAASKIHKTRSGTLKGKLTYMAPEQCKAKPVDARTDVFSLGAVFWELITLHRLFKRESEAAMLDAIINEPIPDPRQYRSDVLPEYAEIAMTALQRDPENRFQSAGAMATAMRAVLRQERYEAGPQQIGQYIRSVLGGRQKAKQELLRELVKSNGHPVEFKVLKPDTEESIPHGPGTESMTLRAKKDKTIPSLADGSRVVSDELSRVSKGRIWKILGIVLLGLSIVVAIVFLAGFRILGEKYHESKTDIWDAGLSGDAHPVSDFRVMQPRVAKGQDAVLDASVADTDPKTIIQGSLDIISRPSGCKVQLDGIFVAGRTPVEDLKIKADEIHTARILCAGYKGGAKEFSLHAGQRRILKFSPARLVNKARKKGTLRLDTSPWSMIYLGKKRLGMTPLVDVELPVGVHYLTAVNKDKGLHKQIKVHIKAGHGTSLQVDLLSQKK